MSAQWIPTSVRTPADPIPASPVIVNCETAAGLSAIAQSETELVILGRALPPGLEAWLDQLDLAAWTTIRLLVEPRVLRTVLPPLLDDMGVAACEPREQLVDDIQDLAVCFAGIARTDRVEVRLEPVSGDACWKFHRDNVKARMLTTYRGPGTEWVQPVHSDQALEEQKTYEGPLEQLRCNDVALFKGSGAGPGSGIVHRSPSIAGSGIRRLLLCLNPRTPASPKPLT